MNLRICTDIGGTFTDLAIVDREGKLVIFKTPTTPSDYIEGVLNAFALVKEHYKLPLRNIIEECSSVKGGFLAHGSTISTNAIIEGRTAKTGLICTKGFRDILTIREGGKAEPYYWDMDRI